MSDNPLAKGSSSDLFGGHTMIRETSSQVIDQLSGGIVAEERTAVARSGFLPDPELLGCLESFAPGATNRILAMAEAEQKERHALDKIGKWLAFIFALIMVGASVYLGRLGHHEVAIAIVAVPVVGVCSVLGINKWKQ